jgi:hypothetical protein
MAKPQSVMVQPVTGWQVAIDWDVARVRTALRSLLNGDFRLAAQLADAMLGDPRIAGDLNTRVLAILGSEVTFEPPNGKRGKSAAKALEGGEFWRIFPEQALKEVLEYGLLLGVVPVQHLWAPGPGDWGVQIRPWWPGYLRYMPSNREYLIETNAGWTPMDVSAPGARNTRSGYEWSLYSPGGFSRPWLGGLVRRLALPFLLRNYAARDWGRWSERHGLPTLKAFVPKEVDVNSEEYKAFVGDLLEMNSEGLIALGQGTGPDGKKDPAYSYDVQLLEAAAQSWEGFLQLKMAAEDDISVAILGNHLVSSPKNQTNGVLTALEVKQDRKTADAQILSTWAHDGVLGDWAQFNYGGRENAPYPKYQVDPPVDEAQEESNLTVVLANLATMRAAGYDTADLEAKYNLKRVAEGQPLPAPGEADQQQAELADPNAARLQEGA